MTDFDPGADPEKSVLFMDGPQGPAVAPPVEPSQEVNAILAETKSLMEKRPARIDLASMGFPDVTPEQIDELERLAGSKISAGDIKLQGKHSPFVGAGFEVADMMSGRMAHLAHQAGSADPSQQTRVLSDIVLAQREMTGGAKMKNVAYGTAPLVAEAMASGAGGAGAIAVSGRLAARAGLKVALGQTRKNLLRLGTTVGLMTTGRETIPRYLGYEGGAWTANSLRRALPDLKVSDDEAEQLAALSEGAFAEITKEQAFKANPLWEGFAEELVRNTAELGVGPLVGKLTTAAVLRGIFGATMKRVASGSDDALKVAKKIQSATALNGPLSEIIEENVSGIMTEGLFGEDWSHGITDDVYEVAAIAMMGAIPGASSATISATRRIMDKRRGAARERIAAAQAAQQEATAGPNDPAGAEKPLEGGDEISSGEATAVTAGVEPGVSSLEAVANPDGETQGSPQEALLAPFRPEYQPLAIEGVQGSVQGLPATAAVVAPGGAAQSEIGRNMFGTLEAVPEAQGGSPVELPHVMKSLAGIINAAGSKQAIREGKAANLPAGIAGGYWTRDRMIDIRSANDIVTGAHEVAHSLERVEYGPADPWIEGGAAKLTPEQRSELEMLGKRLYGDAQPNGGYYREGWSELVKAYITNDGEPAAPLMTEWLTGTFLAKRPEVAKAVEKARDQARRWRLQGSPERVGASIKKRQTRVQKVKEAALTTEGRAEVKEDVYDNFVDMFGVYKRGVQEIEAETGKLLAPSANTYKLASALRQTGPARLEYMIYKGGIDLAGNPTGGPSLRDVKALVKGRGEDFSRYLYARRAKALWEQPIVERLGETESVALVIEQQKETLRNQAGEVPTTEAVLKELGARDPGISYIDTMETLRTLESPDLARAAELVHQWYDGVMDYVAGASPTLAKAVATVRQKDPGAYTPLRRVFNQIDGRGRGGPGGAASGNVAKRLKGSGRQIVDPFQQLIAQAQRHIDMAHERAVLDSVLRWQELAPGMGHLVKEVPVEQVPGASKDIESLIREIERRVPGKSAGADALREELGDSVDEVVTFFMQSRSPSKGDGKAPIIPVMKEGKLKYYQVDAKLFDALAGLHVPQVDGLMSWMAATQKRLFTAGTTGLNPAFTLITNPARDITTYVSNTTIADPVRAIGAYVGGLGEGLLGAVTAGKAPTKFWDAFERLGVKMSQRYAEDNARTETVAKRLAGGGSRVVNFTGDAWNYVIEAMNFPEAAGRIAEMKAVSKKVGWIPGTNMTMDQAIEIALAGKQVTVDFSAAGKIARSVNRYVPFHNVAFQSMRSYVRAVKNNPAKAVAVGVSTFTLPTVLMWLKNKDEEWYQEMEDEERYTNFYMGLDDGGLMKFPRSFEPHFVFATIPEILLNNLYRVNPDAATSLAERITGSMGQVASEARRTFTPNFLPVAAAVASEQLANEVFFFDSPIVDRAMEKRAPEEQYNEYTSRAAIWLGERFGQSPARISHAINGFMGTVGRELQNVTGTEMGELGKETERAEWPIVGRLFKRGGKEGVRSRNVDALYTAYRSALETQSSFKGDETDDQRGQRLYLTDATKVIGAMGMMARMEPKNADRAAIYKKRRDFAREAVESLKDGSWKVERSGVKSEAKELMREKRRLRQEMTEKLKAGARD